MVLEINTQTKQIRIKGTVSAKELFDTLMNMFPDFEYEKWTITEYTLADPVWFPQPQPGIGTWPQQPYVNPNPVLPYSPLTSPGHIWIGDDPNKWGTVTGGLTGTIDLSGGNGLVTVKSSLDQS